VVLVLTGHMLKDVDYMNEAGAYPRGDAIDADAETVIKTLERTEKDATEKSDARN
jgi:hypothetical protein